MRVFHFKSIYTKVLLSLCIVIIPIFILSIIINDVAAKLVKTQISDTMQQKTDYMLNSLESEIERIHQLQKYFINDIDLLALNFRNEYFTSYEWTSTVNRLNTKVQLINSSSKYVKSTSVMMTTINQTFSSKDGIIPLEQSEYSKIVAAMNQGMFVVPDGNRVWLPLAYPTIKKPYIVMAIEFDLDQFHKDMSLLDNNTVSTTWLMDDSGNLLINTNDAVSVNEEWRQQIQVTNSSELHFGNYIIHKQHSSLLGWSIITIFNERSIWTPVELLNRWYWILGAVAVLSIVMFSYFIYRLVHRPMKRLLRLFRKVEDGNFQLMINHDESDEFSYMYFQFDHMLGQIDQLIKQNYEKKIHNQRMELKHLQSQINPHFLYNSLYVLYRMSQEENYEGVTEMSKHLGDYFKFLTRTSGDLISLKQEIEHAKTYAAIQQIRFGERIRCRFHVEGEIEDWQVPRLIIQPLIENAYQHGHRNTYEDGTIEVEVTASKKEVHISISDNGIGLKQEELDQWDLRKMANIDEGNGDGIWNVHRRIQLILGDQNGLMLQNNEGGGLCVNITLQRKD
ncbi:sensor histidine kinase [Paenibacillus sp. SYP-B4298]|uniref:sensor histidine kinase n=1 Tax=Paenibacillus sp. SYP-B4298 TaxID=2996034 RepID=UPI0022DD8D31|nr:histidine kinase [Paenibacillus sp. SYP-B4298]